jgi:peptidoglycan/LPS O-acetylase OafA/YrhL
VAVDDSAGWRLGHRPALDGLRGVAVLLVVVSHMSEMRLRPLGMAGVVMFFTLSGFLITSLLLEEVADTGRADLRAFWIRRARRLLPAAVTCVVVVTTIGLASPTEAVGPLTYTANWRMIDGVGSGGALAHTWSLAIEEQFYLVWPLLLLALVRFGRPVLAGALGSAAALTAILRLADANAGETWARVYYGSDTRADALLLGCLLAVAMHGLRVPRAARLLGPLAVAGIVVAGSQEAGRFVLVWLPLVAAVCSLVALWTAVTTGQRWLELPWLCAVGRVSYGLYLWHWPVFYLFRQWGFDGWGLLVCMPVVVALTWLSWRYVEQPFMRYGRLRTSMSAAPAKSVVVPPAKNVLVVPESTR